MNGEIFVRILMGAFIGVAGTITMDILAIGSGKLGLAHGAKGQWVGRWYLGIPHGRFVHTNIATSPEQRGETRAALVGHYIIGTTLAVLYVLGTEAVGLSPASLGVAIGYGLATCVFPWLLVFPALGFGVFGRHAPSELRVFTASVLNHLGYGIGLWWSASILGLGQ